METMVGKLKVSKEQESAKGTAWRTVTLVPVDADDWPVTLRAVGKRSEGVAAFDGLLARVTASDDLLIDTVTVKHGDGSGWSILDRDGVQRLKL